MRFCNVPVVVGLLCGSLASVTSAFAQTPIHDYELNGSLADANGGPALVADGGTLNATNYAFAANQGLSLSSGLPSASTYSIETVFNFTTLNGYRKIIDFKDRTSDRGLYNLNTDLNFFNFAFGPNGAFVPNTDVDLTLTRDGGTNLVAGYINGVQQISFTDNGLDGVFSSTNNIIRFFEDDFNTNQGEASGGVVDRILIYDTALTATQVATLFNTPTAPPVPEPGSVALLAGMSAVGAGFLRRRNQASKIA